MPEGPTCGVDEAARILQTTANGIHAPKKGSPARSLAACNRGRCLAKANSSEQLLDQREANRSLAESVRCA